MKSISQKGIIKKLLPCIPIAMVIIIVFYVILPGIKFKKSLEGMIFCSSKDLIYHESERTFQASQFTVNNGKLSLKTAPLQSDTEGPFHIDHHNDGDYIFIIYKNLSGDYVIKIPLANGSSIFPTGFFEIDDGYVKGFYVGTNYFFRLEEPLF